MILKTFFALKKVLENFEMVSDRIYILGDTFSIDLEYNEHNWELWKKLKNKYPLNVQMKSNTYYFTLIIMVGEKQ